MKKIFLLVIFFFSITISNFTYSMNPADYLNKIPANFKSQCFEYYTKINRDQVWNEKKWETYKVYKIEINKEDLLFTQFWFILPSKLFFSEDKSYNYSSNDITNIASVNDSNRNTYISFDTSISREINLEFNEKLKENTFDFNFDFDSLYNNYELNISEDWNKYIKVSNYNISDYSFKYLKIKFIWNCWSWQKCTEEKIKIYDINFSKNTRIYLVKSFYNDDIELFANYNCTDWLNFSAKNYNSFEIDKNTKILNIELNQNPKYNVYEKFDIDNDWVEDDLDNCKTRYNPLQEDSNWDWIWDICSDQDNDWIIWYYDNCINVSNRDQKDININWVWDVCEFDKDKDGIFDSLDNCITTPNKDQADKDFDWIWNACDNCELYNPSQIDKDWNNIWDVCDESKKELEDNDKDKDWIIDYKDNCQKIANEDQADKDKDGIWNVCDNCKDIVNSDQIDENKNWVWDMCEDSDVDWILWYIDNCINVSNEDQKDDNNDWVWNACEDSDFDNILFANDNCPFDYNPKQEDIDEDKVWDVCDQKDDRFIESNKTFFIWILVLIALVFTGAIFFMVRKLK